MHTSYLGLVEELGLTLQPSYVAAEGGTTTTSSASWLVPGAGRSRPTRSGRSTTGSSGSTGSWRRASTPTTRGRTRTRRASTPLGRGRGSLGRRSAVHHQGARGRGAVARGRLDRVHVLPRRAAQVCRGRRAQLLLARAVGVDAGDRGERRSGGAPRLRASTGRCDWVPRSRASTSARAAAGCVSRPARRSARRPSSARSRSVCCTRSRSRGSRPSDSRRSAPAAQRARGEGGGRLPALGVA